MNRRSVEVGSLILRVVTGLIFFLHGVDKYQKGLENIAGWFQSVGLPGIMAYAVAGIEIIGGILLIIGLGTRLVSWLMALIMVGAIVKVKWALGLMGNGQMAGYEFDLVLLAANVWLGLGGSGSFAVDRLIGFGGQSKRVITVK